MPPFSASSDQREALALLRNHEDSRQGWFWSTDHDGRLTYLTDNVRPLLSAGGERGIGFTFSDLFLPGDHGGEASRALPFVLIKRSRFEKLTVRTIVADEERWWSLSGRPQFDAAGAFIGYRGSGVDVTEQRLSSEHASKLAMCDPLTGLPNRLRMSEMLGSSLVALDYRNLSCAVMLIDLDRFKAVNDTLGHPAGDVLLQQVAERLLRIADDQAQVFRVGGDEFQIIVRNCADRGLLGELADKIIASLSQPYSVDGSRCIIGASIGMAISPFDGRTGDELIRNADLALYAAKDGGRGRFRFFANELLETAEDKRVLEEDLRDALAKGEIELYYQPIVNAETNLTSGVEALLRWHHPERGSISPTLFIPIAEEANLIEALGEWALRKACADAAQWPGKLRIAVNVSPTQFANEALPAIVISALASSGLAPERLELEITEGVFLRDSSATDQMFAKLKDIGVRLALDDFGTGYSSLSYLRTAPFDKIKIDQSFVRAATLPKSPNRAIIAAIVALAEALHMETTAEGIETHDQLDLIRELRVSHVQGHIYSQAVSAEEMGERVASGDWELAPSGPARQRSDRHSMYRNAGAIFGNYYRSVLVRNLSESGALIEGLVNIPVGTLFLLDFGEGQLAFARVRRRRQQQYGVEFEHPLVSDGDGGLCTSQRVTSLQISQSGLPTSDVPGSAPDEDAGDTQALEALRGKLGMGGAPAKAGMGAQPAGAMARPNMTTITSLSDHYLAQARGDQQQQAADARYLREDILPRFGAMRPDELTPSRITHWLNAKVGTGDCPPEKVSILQGILGQMYILALQSGMPDGDATFRSMANFGRGSHERRLTRDELARLNQAVQTSSNPQLKLVVALLTMTGARQRELLDARWENIDFEKRIWRIPTSEPGRLRTVKLSPAAIDIIKSLPRSEASSHLIINPKTKKPYRSLHTGWDTTRKKAGLWDVELDDLRHCA